MNLNGKAEDSALRLVDIVDLKWLMAGEGVHVHVERLQSDPVYARECLALAASSANFAARQIAARLKSRLAAPVVG
jgi:predicted DNA-binding protein (UPF0251 family)